jgi:Ca-activated chloride channel family protein
MRFEYPYIFALLLLVPAFFWFWMKRAEQPRIRLSFGSSDKENAALSSSSFKSSVVTTLIKCTALTFCIIALARPQSISRSQERKANGIDIMMALDVSLSMLIQDMGDKNRMDTAKQTFQTFIENRKNDRIGFVIFSGEPLTLAPPTLDYGLLLAQLQTVQPGQGLRDGTAIGDGLALAINRLKKSSAKSRVIILLTDGDNNVGRIDPVTAGELALGYGIRVYSIAIGTEGRVRQPLPMQTPLGTTYNYVWVDNRLNPSLLKEISEKTNGKFFRVTDEKSLEQVFQTIDKLEKTEITTKDKVHYSEEFLPYLLAALFCLLFERVLSLAWWRQWA